MPVVEVLLLVVLGLLAVFLTAWAFTVRAMVLHVERAHPDFAATLRARAARKPARMAITSELQKVLGDGEAIPADPLLARLAHREKRLRWSLALAVAIPFLLYVL